MKASPIAHHCVAITLLAAGLSAPARAITPSELLADYSARAGAAAQPERGQRLFTTRGGRELDLSCSSCHTSVPSRIGTHALSDKPIPPLAPAFNKERFTDKSKVERYFRLNCTEVLGRDCTAAEKADVLSWLLTFKP